MRPVFCTAEAGPKFDDLRLAYAGYVDFFRRHLRALPRPVLPANPVDPAKAGKLR